MIRITNLTKRFGEFVAVNGISLDVGTGESVALLGPNGSGKTTTLQCLNGLARPDSGQVLIGGVDIARQPRQARAQMSFLPQRVAFHDNLTALEVLQFYCRLRKLPPDNIDRVIEALDLDGAKSEPVGQFSGGMIQRLGIAVALLPDAPILMLDEPTASLDPEGAAAFRELIRGMTLRGRTILFSTHVLPDVELLADRAAILVGGKLVAVESLEALRSGLEAGSRLRIAVKRPHARLARAAISAGALEAEWAGATLWVSAKPEDRLAILHEIEVVGGVIEHFATEPPSLEEIYLRYVNATSARPVPADLLGLREAVPAAG